jgi:hypothetical protein
MNDMKGISWEEIIDPHLLEKIMLLRHVPPRNPDAAAAAREKFIKEMEGLFPFELADPRSIEASGSIGFLSLIRGKMGFGSARHALASGFAAVLLVLVFLFSGIGITAQASRSALPGDVLYSIKTGLEQARISFALDLSQKAELYMRFAAIRLDEIQKLVEAGRYEEAISLSTEFQTYIQKALETVSQLATFDPVKASALNGEIISKLSTYNQQLNALLAGMPGGVQGPSQQQAPSPGSLSPVTENQNENLNENENEDLNQNQNENENLNENEDRNANGNETNESNGNDNGGEEINDEREGSDHEGNGNDNGSDRENGNGGQEDHSGDGSNESEGNGNDSGGHEGNSNDEPHSSIGPILVTKIDLEGIAAIPFV